MLGTNLFMFGKKTQWPPLMLNTALTDAAAAAW